MASPSGPGLGRLPAWAAAVIAVALVTLVGLAAAAGSPVATSPFEPARSGEDETVARPSFTLGEQELGDDGGWLGYLIGGLVLLALVAFVVTVIVLVVRMVAGRHNGLLRRRVLEPEELELLVTPLPEADLLGRSVEVGDAVAAGLTDVIHGEDVRSSIIAAWLRLERVAADVGTPRRDPDAPDDLVQRLLAAHDVAPRDLEELAELYRRARFSRGHMGERDRAAAVRALDAVRAGLLGVAAGSQPLAGPAPSCWTGERGPARWH